MRGTRKQQLVVDQRRNKIQAPQIGTPRVRLLELGSKKAKPHSSLYPKHSLFALHGNRACESSRIVHVWFALHLTGVNIYSFAHLMVLCGCAIHVFCEVAVNSSIWANKIPESLPGVTQGTGPLCSGLPRIMELAKPPF